MLCSGPPCQLLAGLVMPLTPLELHVPSTGDRMMRESLRDDVLDILDKKLLKKEFEQIFASSLAQVFFNSPNSPPH